MVEKTPIQTKPAKPPCIVVTPAGRKQFLSVLVLYLAAQKDDFVEWQLWDNTYNQEDKDYLKELSQKYSWVKIVTHPQVKKEKANLNIGKFWTMNIDVNAVYIRVDDDIVWMDKDFIRKLYQKRLKYPDALLVSANVINNAILTHIHQRHGNFIFNDFVVQYQCIGNGWGIPFVGLHIHRAFLKAIEQNKTQQWKSFREWRLLQFQRISINTIAYFGSKIKQAGGVPPDIDEEMYVTQVLTKKLNLTNIVVADPIAVHFSFWTQRDVLFNSDLLPRYRAIAEKTYKS